MRSIIHSIGLNPCIQSLLDAKLIPHIASNFHYLVTYRKSIWMYSTQIRGKINFIAIWIRPSTRNEIQSNPKLIRGYFSNHLNLLFLIEVNPKKSVTNQKYLIKPSLSIQPFQFQSEWIRHHFETLCVPY